ASGLLNKVSLLSIEAESIKFSMNIYNDELIFISLFPKTLDLGFKFLKKIYRIYIIIFFKQFILLL
ncbi:MAG: hypothetical protein KDD45_15745, partial [Bdellovibrionales bacterium]|nr:hypothetical protein [Bdellovibrionales bacterium]